jgi:energy-coupling factor transport system permease protein
VILTYYPAKSIIHYLDPRAKLTFVFIFIISVLFETSFTAYGILFILILLPFLLSKLPTYRLIKGFTPFLILFVLTILFHFLLTPGEIIFKFGILKGTLEGLKNGTIFSIRLFLIIIITMFLGLTTSPIDLSESISGIFRRFRSSSMKEIPMIIILTLRFIPFLIREGKRILMAQRARGAELTFGKDFFTVLFPIFNSAFKRADQLALALHAKAYDPGNIRASFRVYRLCVWDYILLCYSLIPFLIVIFV